MANDNIVDFTERAKLVSTTLDDDDPITEVFQTYDIMDVFMTVLMFIRMTSLDETVTLKMADDQIFLEVKNFFGHEDNEGVESAACLNKVGGFSSRR